MLLVSFDNGLTDRHADCCANTFDEKLLLLKFAMATNYITRDDNKLAFPAFIVCAGILQHEKIAKPIPIPRPLMNEPSTSCKNFVNFSAVNPWDVVVSLQQVGRCTHFRCFQLSTRVVNRLSVNRSWIDWINYWCIKRPNRWSVFPSWSKPVKHMAVYKDGSSDHHILLSNSNTNCLAKVKLESMKYKVVLVILHRVSEKKHPLILLAISW